MPIKINTSDFKKKKKTLWYSELLLKWIIIIVNTTKTNVYIYILYSALLFTTLQINHWLLSSVYEYTWKKELSFLNNHAISDFWLFINFTEYFYGITSVKKGSLRTFFKCSFSLCLLTVHTTTATPLSK